MVSKSPTITDAELIRLSCQNPELGFERNADGTLVTMPPIGSISANRELKAGARLLPLRWGSRAAYGQARRPLPPQVGVLGGVRPSAPAATPSAGNTLLAPY